MAKSILLKVLHEHFGKYVVGINEENLKLGIWAGEVDLRNLEIKKEALDDLRLPLDIKVGHIDKLHADIPWTRLGHEPVKVTIDGVYLLAVIRDNTDDSRNDKAGDAGMLTDSEHAKKQALRDKRQQLKWADLIERSTAENEDSAKNADTSFMSRLASKVMDNLQIVITNVHIRFEDSVGNSLTCTDPSKAKEFAFGVTLERFEAVTCDEKGVNKFMAPDTDRTIMYKNVATKSVAVYWDSELSTSAVDSSLSMPSIRDAMRRTIRGEVDDSEYKNMELVKAPGGSRKLLERRKDPNFVLRPCSISLFVAKNTTADFSIPRFNMQLSCKHLALVVSETQYETMAMFLKHAQQLSQKTASRDIRPAVPVRLDPRAWWRYAIKTVGQKSLSRRWHLHWRPLVRKMLASSKYVVLYKQAKQKGGADKLAVDKQTKLNELEEELVLEDILAFRARAIEELKKENKAKNKAAKNEDHSLVGWVTGWFGASNDSGKSLSSGIEEALEISDGALHLTSEEQDEIINAINYVEAAESLSAPEGSLHVAVDTSVKFASLTLVRADGRELVSLNLAGTHRLETFVGDNWKMSARLLTIQVANKLTDDSSADFPYIVTPKMDANDNDNDSCAVEFSVELHPPNDADDMVATLKCVPLKIVVVPSWMHALTRFLAVDAVRELQDSAVERLQAWGDATQHELLEVLAARTKIRLCVNIAAPIIAFPLEPSSRSGLSGDGAKSLVGAKRSVLICDLGKLSINSQKESDVVGDMWHESNTSVFASGKEPVTGDDDDDDDEGFVSADSCDDVGKVSVVTSPSAPRLTPYDTFSITLKSAQVMLIQATPATMFDTQRTSGSLPDQQQRYHSVMDELDVSICLQLSVAPSVLTVARTRVSVVLPTLHIHLAPVFLQYVDNLSQAFVDPDAVAAVPDANPQLQRGMSVRSLGPVPEEPLSPRHGDVEHAMAYGGVGSGLELAVLRLHVKTLSVDVSNTRRHVTKNAAKGQDDEFTIEPLAQFTLAGIHLDYSQRKNSSLATMRLRELTLLDMNSHPGRGSATGGPRMFASSSHTSPLLDLLQPTIKEEKEPAEEKPAEVDLILMNLEWKHPTVKTQVRRKQSFSRSGSMRRSLGSQKALLPARPQKDGGVMKVAMHFNTLHIEWDPDTVVHLMSALRPPTSVSMSGSSVGRRSSQSAMSESDTLQTRSRFNTAASERGSWTRPPTPSGSVSGAETDATLSSPVLDVTMTLKSFSISLLKTEAGLGGGHASRAMQTRTLLVVVMNDAKIGYYNDSKIDKFRISGELGNFRTLLPKTQTTRGNGSINGSTASESPTHANSDDKTSMMPVEVFSSHKKQDNLIKFMFATVPQTNNNVPVQTDCDAVMSLSISPSLLVYSQQLALEVVDYLFQAVLGPILPSADDNRALPASQSNDDENDTNNDTPKSDMEVDTSEQPRHTSTRLKLDIELSELYVILPRDVYQMTKYMQPNTDDTKQIVSEPLVHYGESLTAKCASLRVENRFFSTDAGTRINDITVLVGDLSLATLAQEHDAKEQSILLEDVGLRLSIVRPLDDESLDVITKLVVRGKLTDIKLTLTQAQYHTLNAVIQENILAEEGEAQQIVVSDGQVSHHTTESNTHNNGDNIEEREVVEEEEVNEEVAAAAAKAAVESYVQYLYGATDAPALTFKIAINFSTASLLISDAPESPIAVFAMRTTRLSFVRPDTGVTSIHWVVQALDLCDRRPTSEDHFYKHLILSDPNHSTTDSSNDPDKTESDAPKEQIKKRRLSRQVLGVDDLRAMEEEETPRSAFELLFVPEQHKIKLKFCDVVGVVMIDLFFHVLDFILDMAPAEPLANNTHTKAPAAAIGEISHKNSELGTHGDKEAELSMETWTGHFDLSKACICFVDDLKRRDAQIVTVRSDINIDWLGYMDHTKTYFNVTLDDFQAYRFDTKSSKPGMPTVDEGSCSKLMQDKYALLGGRAGNQLVEPTSFDLEYSYEKDEPGSRIHNRRTVLILKQTEAFVSVRDIRALLDASNLLAEQMENTTVRRNAVAAASDQGILNGAPQISEDDEDEQLKSLVNPLSGDASSNSSPSGVGQSDDESSEDDAASQYDLGYGALASNDPGVVNMQDLGSLSSKKRASFRLPKSQNSFRQTSTDTVEKASRLAQKANPTALFKRVAQSTSAAMQSTSAAMNMTVRRRSSQSSGEGKGGSVNEESRGWSVVGGNSDANGSAVFRKGTPDTMTSDSGTGTEMEDEEINSNNAEGSWAEATLESIDPDSVEYHCTGMQGFASLGLVVEVVDGFLTVLKTNSDKRRGMGLNHSLLEAVVPGDILLKARGRDVVSESLEMLNRTLHGDGMLMFRRAQSDAPVILHDTVHVKSGVLVMYVVDDTDDRDLPLAHINFPVVEAFYNSTVGNTACGIQVVMAMHYYSTVQARWELVMSPWEANVVGSIDQAGRIDVSIDAANSLNFQVPDTFLAVVLGAVQGYHSMDEGNGSIVAKGSTIDDNAALEGKPSAHGKAMKMLLDNGVDPDKKENKEYVGSAIAAAGEENVNIQAGPYVVRNRLGIAVDVRRQGGQNGTDMSDDTTTHVGAKADESFGFTHIPANGVGAARTYGHEHLVSMAFPDELWEPVYDICVSKVGSGIVRLNPAPVVLPEPTGSDPDRLPLAALYASGSIRVPVPTGQGGGHRGASNVIRVTSRETLPADPMLTFTAAGSRVAALGLTFKSKVVRDSQHEFDVQVTCGVPWPQQGIIIEWEARAKLYPCPLHTYQHNQDRHHKLEKGQTPVPPPMPMSPIAVKWQVALEGGRLTLTFRSMIRVVNHADTALRIMVNSPHWSDGPVVLSESIPPRAAMYVPVLLGEATEIRVRPAIETSVENDKTPEAMYEWSQAVYQSLASAGKGSGVSAVESRMRGRDGSVLGFHFHVQVSSNNGSIGSNGSNGDVDTTVFAVYPDTTIRNLLPVPIAVQHVFGKHRLGRSFLGAGEEAQLHQLPAHNRYCRVAIMLNGDSKSRWSEPIDVRMIIAGSGGTGPSGSPSNKSNEIDDQGRIVQQGLTVALVGSDDGNEICHVRLRCELSPVGGWSILVFCPYWIVNRTMLPMRYASGDAKPDNDAAWVGSIGINGAPGGIVMYTPKDDRVQFRVADSDPGPVFPVDRPGLSGRATVPHGNKFDTNFDVGVSVDIAPGMLYRTNLVTLVPRYVVLNRCQATAPIGRSGLLGFGGESTKGVMDPSNNTVRRPSGGSNQSSPSNGSLEGGCKKSVPYRKLALRFAGSDIDGPGALMTALPGECVPFWGVPNKERSKDLHGGSGKSVENRTGYILQIRIDPVTQWSKPFNVDQLLNTQQTVVLRLPHMDNPRAREFLQLEVRAGDAAASICIEVKDFQPQDIVHTQGLTASAQGVPLPPVPHTTIAAATFAETKLRVNLPSIRVVFSEGNNPISTPSTDVSTASTASPRLARAASTPNANSAGRDLVSAVMTGVACELAFTGDTLTDQVRDLKLTVESFTVTDLASGSAFPRVFHGGDDPDAASGSSRGLRNGGGAAAASLRADNFIHLLIRLRHHPYNLVFERFALGLKPMQVKVDERFIEMCVNKWQGIQLVAGTNTSSSSAAGGSDRIVDILNLTALQALVPNGVNSKPGVEAIKSIQQVAREEVAQAYLGAGGEAGEGGGDMSSFFLYFGDLLLSNMVLRLSYQQHPNPNSSVKLYDLGGGLLSRMKIRVDDAPFKLKKFAQKRMFVSSTLLLNNLKRHYIDQARAQMLDILRSVNLVKTDWGITSTIFKTLMGEQISSEEFVKESLSNSAIVNKYRTRIAQCPNQNVYLRDLRNMVFDWRYNHRGLSSRRCICVGLVNRSRSAITFEPVLLRGASFHLLLAQKVPPGSAARLAPWNGTWQPGNSAMIIAWGFMSDKVDLRVLSLGFTAARFYHKEASLTPNVNYSASFLYKEPDSWHSAYAIVVDDLVKA